MTDKNKKKIIVRYPPSPTGLFHIGTARTCLYNYLFARKNQGKIIFRLEDTDLERSREEYANNIADGLKKLGLAADEGWGIGGNNGPYRQTERLDIYKKYLLELLDKNLAYWCYCTKEELEVERKKCEECKKPYRYAKSCCNLNDDQIKEKKVKNPSPVIRLKSPDIKEVVFKDLIRGEIKVQAKELDDYIIAKSLDEPLYNFSVVIDDHLMGITHVIRGEDHISNTPRQILLYQTFGWKIPEFAHMPLILNQDKSKLSKRKNQVSVDAYLQEGYLSEAIINFLALLGWAPADNREIFTLNELIQEFDLSRVHKSGAIFNLEKLDWLNNQHIKMLLPNDLTERIKPYLQTAKIGYNKNENKDQDEKKNDDEGEDDPSVNSGSSEDEYLVKAVKTIQERLFKLSQAPEQLKFYFIEPEFNQDLLYNEKMGVDEKLLAEIWPKIGEFVNNLDESKFNEEDLKNEFTEFIKSLGLKNGQVLWPVRVALTGLDKSPGVFEVMGVLGKDESLKRINKILITG